MAHHRRQGSVRQAGRVEREAHGLEPVRRRRKEEGELQIALLEQQGHAPARQALDYRRAAQAGGLANWAPSPLIMGGKGVSLMAMRSGRGQSSARAPLGLDTG